VNGSRLLRLGLVPGGIALGVASLSIARHEPGYAFAGRSEARAAVELAAGWALLGVGLVSWGRRPASRFGPILVLASLGWFLLEWNNPGAGSSAAFTTGLVLSLSAPPLVAHAVLSYVGGGRATGLARAVIVAGYADAVLLIGLLPALVFDPAAAGCSECPANLLLVHGDAGLSRSVAHAGVYGGLVWVIVTIVVGAWQLARATAAARRVAAPVLLSGLAYLGLVGAELAHSLDRGFVDTDAVDRRLWLWQAAALLGLCASVLWTWVRARRTRSAIARLVVEATDARGPGGLSESLGRSLGDASLRIAYPLAGGARHVDATGHPVELEGTTTRLVRNGQTLAVLLHRPGLLDDPDLAAEVAMAAGLALENERLHSESSAQLEYLRQSRARIVAAGDAERKRLERDLHDGAQQRLVALSLSLRLARSSASAETACRLDEADDELRSALAELRRLAQGIYPTSLADEGLCAALEALAESGAATIDSRLADERFEPMVEATAYFVVAEIVSRAHEHTRVRVHRSDGVLVIEADGTAGNGLADVDDRIGAIDGTLSVEAGRIRAEIPCA
jgi:signal transduction histidine kinase